MDVLLWSRCTMPLNKTLLPYFKARPYYFKLICSEIQGIVHLSGSHVCDRARWQSSTAPAQANGKLRPGLRGAGPRFLRAGLPHQAVCPRETRVTPVKVKKKGEKFPSCVLASRGVCTLAPQHRTRLSGRMYSTADFRFTFPSWPFQSLPDRYCCRDFCWLWLCILPITDQNSSGKWLSEECAVASSFP